MKWAANTSYVICVADDLRRSLDSEDDIIRAFVPQPTSVNAANETATADSEEENDSIGLSSQIIEGNINDSGMFIVYLARS